MEHLVYITVCCVGFLQGRGGVHTAQTDACNADALDSPCT